MSADQENTAGSSSKPNITAWFIAQSTLAAHHHPRYRNLIKKETLALYEIFSRECGKKILFPRMIRLLPYAWQFKLAELLTTPGRARHFILRKNAIEGRIRKLLADAAIEQVIILGAGLDVLSLQLAREFPSVQFIEVDREESQLFKTSALRSHHVSIPSNIEYVSGDLSWGLYEVMKHSQHFKKGAITLWLGEGFFMFLPESSCQQIFKEIRTLSFSGSIVMFTTISKAYQGSLFARVFQKLYLSRKKSGFSWTISSKDIPRYMKQLDYRVIDQLSYEVLHKDYLAPDYSLAGKIGEDIQVASCM